MSPVIHPRIAPRGDHFLIEPLSEDIQHNGPTCVANVLEFATAPRPLTGLERSLAQKSLIRRC